MPCPGSCHLWASAVQGHASPDAPGIHSAAAPGGRASAPSTRRVSRRRRRPQTLLRRAQTAQLNTVAGVRAAEKGWTAREEEMDRALEAMASSWQQRRDEAAVEETVDRRASLARTTENTAPLADEGRRRGPAARIPIARGGSIAVPPSPARWAVEAGPALAPSFVFLRAPVSFSRLVFLFSRSCEREWGDQDTQRFAPLRLPRYLSLAGAGTPWKARRANQRVRVRSTEQERPTQKLFFAWPAQGCTVRSGRRRPSMRQTQLAVRCSSCQRSDGLLDAGRLAPV